MVIFLITFSFAGCFLLRVRREFFEKAVIL